MSGPSSYWLPAVDAVRLCGWNERTPDSLPAADSFQPRSSPYFKRTIFLRASKPPDRIE